jgi:2'-5' RNA ligase
MKCIFLLPSNLDPLIQEFRLKHDPQSQLVPPHVTVVFPFEVELNDDELTRHCQRAIKSAIKGVNRIEAKLGPISIEPNGYVFFLLDQGGPEIAEIHNQLYSGPLRDQFIGTSFKPHITIARFDDYNRSEVTKAANLLKPNRGFVIDQIVVEEIENNGASREISRTSFPE